MSIVVYASRWCPYCVAARQLLADKSVAFEEIDVDQRPGARREMMQRAGRHTVPQVFAGEQHLGGYDDLARLDARGELDTILKSS